MTQIAVSARGLGKWYVVNEIRFRSTLSEKFGKLLSSPFRRQAATLRADEKIPEAIWALRDVSFDLEAGKVLAVIGRNGSGKSTLLRILGRITSPTTGSATVMGRVGALLEVGTGFHPDLSGRENILLSGTMIGMKPNEIRRREEEIVAFSEVRDFIDTPVKHYSSGMFLRLAFSVAAHLEAEIMLVDEILAVGDEAFQRKCKEKIRDIARTGRTVFFTSHDMDSVLNICHEGLVLSQGRVVQYGDIKSCVDTYLTQRSVEGPEAPTAEVLRI